MERAIPAMSFSILFSLFLQCCFFLNSLQSCPACYALLIVHLMMFFMNALNILCIMILFVFLNIIPHSFKLKNLFVSGCRRVCYKKKDLYECICTSIFPFDSHLHWQTTTFFLNIILNLFIYLFYFQVCTVIHQLMIHHHSMIISHMSTFFLKMNK